MKTWLSVLVLLLGVASTQVAHAGKRLGGGKSMGQQSSHVTQREASAGKAAPAPAAPNTPAAATPAPAAPAAPLPAAPPRRPWGAMLGGVAAGLGLAWLAHSMGLGAGFGEFMLMALVLMLGLGLLRLWMRSRSPAGLAFQGAAAAPVVPASAPSYNPKNVGNDASARPWEQSRAGALEVLPRHEGVSSLAHGVAPSSHAPETTSSWGIPAGFDTTGFIATAKQNFVMLQKAWDQADIPALREMMTDLMLAEIKSQLGEREAQAPGALNTTEVVMLEARLLGVETLSDGYLASVEFSGLIREEPSAGPSPFREVWNLSKPLQGGNGWLVAGVQALQ